MAKVKYTLRNVGAYADSSRGIYVGQKVQEIARAHGWKGEYLAADAEFYDEAIDEAEAYMNEHYPVEGAYWGSNDNGDWGLWTAEQENPKGVPAAAPVVGDLIISNFDRHDPTDGPNHIGDITAVVGRATGEPGRGKWIVDYSLWNERPVERVIVRYFDVAATFRKDLPGNAWIIVKGGRTGTAVQSNPRTVPTSAEMLAKSYAVANLNQGIRLYLIKKNDRSYVWCEDDGDPTGMGGETVAMAEAVMKREYGKALFDVQLGPMRFKGNPSAGTSRTILHRKGNPPAQENPSSYARDPHRTTVRFDATCAGCRGTIKAGEEAYYYPRLKSAGYQPKVYCFKKDACGPAHERDFESHRQDEDFMSGNPPAGSK